MKYTSEYIEEILTSPAARRGLDYITPVYQNAYVALWLMQAIGLQTDRIVGLTEEYMKQILPQTATWLLPYWEEEYGIATNIALTLEQRRSVILSAIRTRAPMNPARACLLIETATGLKTEIIENVTKYSFHVGLFDIQTGGYANKVRKILNEVKPAHLSYYIIGTFPIYKGENKNTFDMINLTIFLRHSNLGLERTSLNGMRNLDGTWNLGAAMGVDKRFHEFTVWLRNENIFRGISSVGICNRNVFRNSMYAFLHELFISVRFNNFGLDNMVLDGRRSLNGSWTLSSMLPKGIRFYSLLFHMNNRERNEGKAVDLLASVKGSKEEGKGQLEGFRLLEMGFVNRRLARPYGLQINGRVKSKNSNGTAVTTDTLYSLDGQVRLNGGRKLNANRIREEL